jgi:hypothetical protein
MPSPDLRTCRLYRFYVEHPLTGEEVLGYVGETIREPFERLMEHVQSQPWIDTVTRWEKDPRVFASKRDVLKAEAAAIRAERPLYNVIGNEHNDDRIIPPDAIRQRRARDAQQVQPRWVHPNDRLAPAVRRVRAPSRRPAWQVKVALWTASWLLVAVTFAGLCIRHAEWPIEADLSVGGGSALALLAWGVWRKPDTRAMWRRRWRRWTR